MLPINPTNTAETNPYAGEFEVISEPILNDSSRPAWYMAAGQNQGVDLVEMAYLDGIRQPMVEWREGLILLALISEQALMSEQKLITEDSTKTMEPRQRQAKEKL